MFKIIIRREWRLLGVSIVNFEQVNAGWIGCFVASLLKMFPNAEFFLCLFSGIRIEYGDSQGKYRPTKISYLSIFCAVIAFC